MRSPQFQVHPVQKNQQPSRKRASLLSLGAGLFLLSAIPVPSRAQPVGIPAIPGAPYLGKFNCGYVRAVSQRPTVQMVQSEIEQYRALLQNPEGAEFAKALGQLGCFGPQAQAAVPDLVAIANNPSLAKFAPRALVSLSQIAPESTEFRNLILALLFAEFSQSDGLPPIPLWTIQDALEPLGDRAAFAVPGLVHRIQLNLPGERGLAIHTMGRIGATAYPAVPAITTALKNDPEQSVRGYAALALGRIGVKQPAVIQALTATLNSDETEYVRMRAAIALTDLGELTANALPQSIKTLACSHQERFTPALHNLTIQSLTQLTSSLLDNPDRLEKLSPELQNEVLIGLELVEVMRRHSDFGSQLLQFNRSITELRQIPSSLATSLEQASQTQQRLVQTEPHLVIQAVKNWESDMEPTLQRGDLILAETQLTPQIPLQRGDILLVNNKEPSVATQVKSDWLPSRSLAIRLLGLPGETVSVLNGQLQINQQVIEEPYATLPPEPEPEPAQQPDSEWGSFPPNPSNFGFEVTPLQVAANQLFVLTDQRYYTSFDLFLSGGMNVRQPINQSAVLGRAVALIGPGERQTQFQNVNAMAPEISEMIAAIAEFNEALQTYSPNIFTADDACLIPDLISNRDPHW